MNCYIGIKKCGCVTCAYLVDDDCLYGDDLEQTIQEWKKDGLKIELVDVEEARDRLQVCKHKQERLGK